MKNFIAALLVAACFAGSVNAGIVSSVVNAPINVVKQASHGVRGSVKQVRKNVKARVSKRKTSRRHGK